MDTTTRDIVGGIGHAGVIAVAIMLVVTVLWLIHDARRDERDWQAHLTLQTSIDDYAAEFISNPKTPTLVTEDLRIVGILARTQARSIR